MSTTTGKTRINRSSSFSLQEKRTLREALEALQVSGVAAASEAHSLSGTYQFAEIEAALDALGAKINAILDALA